MIFRSKCTKLGMLRQKQSQRFQLCTQCCQTVLHLSTNTAGLLGGLPRIQSAEVSVMPILTCLIYLPVRFYLHDILSISNIFPVYSSLIYHVYIDKPHTSLFGAGALSYYVYKLCLWADLGF